MENEHPDPIAMKGKIAQEIRSISVAKFVEKQTNQESAFSRLRKEQIKGYYGLEGVDISQAYFLDEYTRSLLGGLVASINASDANPVSPLKIRRSQSLFGDIMAQLESDKSRHLWRVKIHTATVRIAKYDEEGDQFVDVFGDNTIRHTARSGNSTNSKSREYFAPMNVAERIRGVGILTTFDSETIEKSVVSALAELKIKEWVEPEA